ncbi:ankyrin, partial [Lojkania enalia]
KGWTPLHYAAHHNREAALVHYIRTGHSLDGSAGSKESPLCIAVAAGHTQIVKLLCQGGADVNYATQDKGETALHIALKNGRTDIVEILLSYGPGIEIRTKDTYETPLHYAAAKTGSLAAVVTLLKSGADYEARDHSGYTPAEVAIRTLNIHAAVAIISSARGKRKKLIKEKDMLLRHVENAQNRYSMTNELISALFEASCDPDSTILVEAIKRDDLSLARMFLEKGADPNRATTAGLRPIFVAIGCSSAKMVQLLVKHKVDVTVRDPDCLNVLQAALESPLAHDKEAVTGIFESLLSRGADANILYPDGKTLLHHAVGPGLGLSMVAQMLLQHGVGVNKADNSGCTALHLSAQNKSCIEVLLRNGADTRLVNCKGLTPLLSAITLATKETEPDVEPLVKASNLCAQNPDKKTALHIAAERGLERTVKLLLNYRAETTSTDYKARRTALFIAAENGFWEILDLLLQSGARIE